ncbi:MAG: phosphate signaling complex protein PhoU [Acidimicrobiales bacterium]|nr:phosphate signaling complex protein PhoU [Acidimicrobiales bacterium]
MSEPTPAQPLRVGYHRELDAIDQKVIRLFALVSEAVAAANLALLADDTDALANVRAGEATIDELMVELEHDIERLLLLQAPVAGELRYALTLIRIVPELERSGDLAEHIAKRAGSGLAPQLTPTARGMLERMGIVAEQIWRTAADAFADRDAPAAEGLEQADDELDDLHTALTTELLSGSVATGLAADATLVARFYERLGDHAVHIGARVARAVR